MRYLSLIILMIYSLNVQAQPRYALVIGNSNYNEPGKKGYLTNPVNDAKDMKALLTNKLGFTVIEGYDVNKKDFNRLIQKFNKLLRKSETPAVALFYFSGHGFSGKDQSDNDTNYLVPLWPKDEPPTDQVSLEYSSISSNYIVTAMRRYNKKGINMMVLDACRGSPKGFVQSYQEKGGSGLGGFVSMDSSGVFLAYATALGRSSYGVTDKRNSIYTGKLLEVLSERPFWSKNITEVFNETAFRVAEFTQHFQEPWFSASGIKFCFENCSYLPQASEKSDISSDISQQLRTCQRHFKANRLTTGVGGTALSCYSQVLKKDPNNAEALAGLEKIEAKYVAWIESALSRGQKKRAQRYMASLHLVNPESPKLAAFEDQMQVPTPPPIQPQTVIPQPRQSFSAGQVFQDRLKDGSKGPQMVWIAAGSFKMGSNKGDDDEKPVLKVGQWDEYVP
ncbi:peptidase C14 caspase catalytic subunit p20 [Candidatus Thiomargarita nelsonii]|uniref:Peptidase C14 caspase catalytic subunit p20 n=1 Tax=Candidatus Thiomargarita nelsonii TaxID=1003181 RepID=A0A0A6P1H2_9GAMM|nr:peptidase C14 caspase catalytic subunit p20 [Candidatus Thiomargarita nelsonii]